MFITSEVFFKSIVMFFELTSSPVTFQIIINEILYDLINTRKVGSFIDNIIVEIEEEEGHNKVVKEVIKDW